MAGKGGHRILIVDHEAEQAERISMALDGAGFGVLTCRFALDAFGGALRSFKPTALIVCAELGSTDLTSILIRNDQGPGTASAIVLLCKDNSDESFARSMKRGVIDILEEPFSPRSHLGRIRMSLNELNERPGRLKGQGAPNEIASVLQHLLRARRTGTFLTGEGTPNEGRAVFMKGMLKSAKVRGLEANAALTELAKLKQPWTFVEESDDSAAPKEDFVLVQSTGQEWGGNNVDIDPQSALGGGSIHNVIDLSAMEQAAQGGSAMQMGNMLDLGGDDDGDGEAQVVADLDTDADQPPPPAPVSFGFPAPAPAPQYPPMPTQPAPMAMPMMQMPQAQPQQARHPSPAPQSFPPPSAPSFAAPIDEMASRTPLMFVDDDPAVLQMLTSYFSKRGFPVSATRDGIEAMQLLVQNPVEMVIADLNMPRLDGWGLLRTMRDDTRTQEIPVGLYSAQDDYRENLRLLHSGAQAYFPKTMKLSALEAQVVEVLAPRRRLLRMLPPEGAISHDFAALGPQWVLRALEGVRWSGQLDARDSWATWRAWFDQGRLVQITAKMGATGLKGDRALIPFLQSKQAEGTLSSQGRAPDEGFAGQPTSATLGRLVPWLNDEAKRTRDDQLQKAKALIVNEELYRLYVTVGPPAWMPIAKLLCEQRMAPAQVMTQLQVSPLEVAGVVKDLLRRGVATLHT